VERVREPGRDPGVRRSGHEGCCIGRQGVCGDSVGQREVLPEEGAAPEAPGGLEGAGGPGQAARELRRRHAAHLVGRLRRRRQRHHRPGRAPEAHRGHCQGGGGRECRHRGRGVVAADVFGRLVGGGDAGDAGQRRRRGADVERVREPGRDPGVRRLGHGAAGGAGRCVPVDGGRQRRLLRPEARAPGGAFGSARRGCVRGPQEEVQAGCCGLCCSCQACGGGSERRWLAGDHGPRRQARYVSSCRLCRVRYAGMFSVFKVDVLGVADIDVRLVSAQTTSTVPSCAVCGTCSTRTTATASTRRS